MINQPPIDELTEKAGDKYSLCYVVAKRAKELAQNPDAPAYFKAISYAAKEFDEDRTEIVKR